MTGPRRLPLIAAALAAVLLAVLVFSTVRVRADMGDFVPAGENAATRFLREEIRSGVAPALTPSPALDDSLLAWVSKGDELVLGHRLEAFTPMHGRSRQGSPSPEHRGAGETAERVETPARFAADKKRR